MSEQEEAASRQVDNEPAKSRAEPPAIHEGGEDSPLFGEKDLTTSTTSDELSLDDKRKNYQLSKGMELVLLCVFLIFLLAIVSVFPWAQKSEVIPAAVDTLKLITTTVVGFVFGSHWFSQKKDGDK
ncbi:hypothetical protein [Corynebacterium diphtheriae]|uniref:Membrane protein n=2 Tax=Corynebacterium diphtheriae TaxID=1717 RepID=Q6NG81_CORDI|nr:hypothetical protein [Corynebacterium diphtheriae]KKA81337.1 hypothetical protein VN94_06225 [Corynebacterium diphtheriae]UJM21235.1 hypothetical protein FE377_07805 [Corynebacterium diphtheriae]UWE73750.1 hypothetical protein NY045_02330 [Corynebacterium diphtheriae bv. gravis]UWE74946.1 hypothetical protein NY043_09270 [Corynebacterium diphtheriae bv. gravis]UWE76502.1 hypothetical protein NY032_05960 [Corynebacterium diphtheriae bv. gravis]